MKLLLDTTTLQHSVLKLFPQFWEEKGNVNPQKKLGAELSFDGSRSTRGAAALFCVTK